MRGPSLLAALALTACATAPVETSAPAPAPPVATFTAVAPAPAPKPAHPDFTGVWGYNSRGVQADAQGNAFTNFPARNGSLVNFETDFGPDRFFDETHVISSL